MPPKLLSRKEAASMLGLQPQTLAKWHSTKRYTLPYIRVGRLVKYKVEDIEAFVIQNSFNSPPHPSRQGA